MQDYRKLAVYQDAYSLTKDIYRITKNWPSEELFNLTVQIRKSAHSVNSNICEGAARNTVADMLRFLYNAYASLQETENHLRLAFDVGYISKEEFEQLTLRFEILSKMLNNFILYKKTKSHRPTS